MRSGLLSVLVGKKRKAFFATFAHSPVGAAVAETLSADAAQVRLLAAVDPQVLFECRPIRRDISLRESKQGQPCISKLQGLHLSRTDLPQTKQVHFLLPPCVHSMCLFLLPVSLNCLPQISQGKGPEKSAKACCKNISMHPDS